MFFKFVFDGILSDEYGIQCVNFSQTFTESYPSQETNIQAEKSVGSSIFHMVSQEYLSPLTYKIQVVNRDFSPITSTQERALNKWLCQRGKYKLFCILDKRYADIWFYANINNPSLMWINDVNALEYTITTNAPFGFSDERNILVEFTRNDTFEQYIDNDEELTLYPSMEILLKDSGTLTITNQSAGGFNDNVFTVANCATGEMITIDASYPRISSSIQSHKVYNDFKKKWFYWIDGFNTIHSNLACAIRFKYREYRKVGIV
ncbi:MAG: hypothetical protein HFG54_14995 [Lachnospiraceae bacterium]|jgi:phage-related protein|nr:hypothetical protein [Lachnospiraceae bacterium]